jgi:transcription initiation factor TFIIB
MEISSLNIANLDEDDLFCILDQLCYNDRHNLEDDKIVLKDFKEETKPEQEEEVNFCKNCNSADNVIEDQLLGIAVCTGPNCGNVLSTLIDTRPEWKQYDNGTYNKSGGRCSMPLNHFYPQSSLGTSISGYYRSNIKTLHGWSAMPYPERSLRKVLKEIETGCSKAGILKCIEDDAKILCKNISECKHSKGVNKGKKVISRGKNRKGLIAACVFFACRRKGKTRSPKEIADIFELKNTQITKGCKLFIKLMKLLKITFNLNSSASEHFIPRFCYKLHINENLIKQTLKIAKNIQKLNVASVHTPLSIATGAILLMANINGLNISRQSISSHFGVTDVTVMKTYKKLIPYKKLLVNDILTDKLLVLMEEERKKAVMPPHIQQMYDVVNQNIKDEANEEEEEDSDDEEFDEDVIEHYKKEPFTIDNDDIEDYINTIHLNLYEMLENTDCEYANIMAEHKKIT